MWEHTPQYGVQGALRFYRFQRPTLTLGRLQKAEKLPPHWNELDLELQWRPTGGRAVLHLPEADLCYGFCTRLDHPVFGGDTVASSRAIQEVIRQGIQKLGVETEFSHERAITGPGACCFKIRSECELMIGGRKVSGTAQARGKEWFFQQGAIILDWRREEWERVFPELTAESPVLDGLAQYQPSLDLDRLEAAITEAFIQNGLEFEEIPGLKQATLGKADS
jgi:lipoate-protein ligase A